MSLEVLYTIVPPEIIYGDDEGEEGDAPAPEQLVEMGGVPLLVRPDGRGGNVVSRLLSTNPRDFLDPRWQPGTRVRV